MNLKPMLDIGYKGWKAIKRMTGRDELTQARTIRIGAEARLQDAQTELAKKHAEAGRLREEMERTRKQLANAEIEATRLRSQLTITESSFYTAESEVELAKAEVDLATVWFTEAREAEEKAEKE